MSRAAKEAGTGGAGEAPVNVITTGFSAETENHGIQIVVVSLDRVYAGKLARAVRAFDSVFAGSDLGEVSEVVIQDGAAIFTGYDEERGLNDDYTGDFGVLAADVELPESEAMKSKHLVVQRGGVLWTGLTYCNSTVESQLLPLDFLDAVARGDRDEAVRIASLRRPRGGEGDAAEVEGA